jgi:hypothetical protein
MFSLVGLDNQGKKQNLKVKTRENKWYSQLSPMAKEERLKKQRIAHEEKNAAPSHGQSETPSQKNSANNISSFDDGFSPSLNQVVSWASNRVVLTSMLRFI